MTPTREQDARNPLGYLVEKMWRYSEGNRKTVICVYLAFIVAETIQSIVPQFAFAKVINIIQVEGITKFNFWTLCGLLSLLAVADAVFWLFHGPARVEERSNAFLVRVNYRKYLLRGVMNLPLSWHADHHSGDTIDKVEKGVQTLHAFSSEAFESLYSVLRLVISFAVLAYFFPASSVVMVVASYVTYRMVVWFDRRLNIALRKLNHAENGISESVFDTISNITTVVILRVENLLFNTMSKKMDEPYDLDRQTNKRDELKWFLTNMCCCMMKSVVLGIYLWQCLGSAQKVLVGDIFLLTQYLDRASRTFFQFTWLYGSVVRKKSRIENAEEVAKDFCHESFTNHVLPKSWKRLEVGGLCFSYAGGDEVGRELNGVSMELGRGERIAFVGESGGGKTTMLKVMRGLYDPQNLKLSVDGKPIPEGFGGISRAITLIPQDPEIFATTIFENITLGAEHSMDVVRHATDVARFTEVVERLPKKFLSSIKEKGVNLSGGQQQRLALARGLVACRDKDIVLLDEPTSSVDAANELEIFNNIFCEFAGKTIICSVHRLHLLSLFHRIYMFSGGKIIGHGTVDELLASCNEFRVLWQKYHESEHLK